MFVSIVLLCLCIFITILQLKSQRPKNFPPGPLNVPLLGSIFHLSLDNPLKDFEKLRKSYGDVYSIFIGHKPAVVINGVKAMKEAMVTKATDFAGRPQGLFINDVTDGKGVILADYGSKWKEHRRFALTTLRNFGLGKNSMENRIHDEIKHIISTLEKSIGKTMSPQVMFHNAASNIICQVLFARRYEYDDELIKLFVEIFTEISKITNGPWATLYDSYPIIRNLPLPFQKAFRKVEIYKKHSLRLVSEHKKSRVPGEPRDFIDCYLDELEKRADEGSSFSEEELIMETLNLHFAGTDTTSNTLLTGFLYLINHPHVQERCQQEIDQVLDGKDRVLFEDRHNMPYVQACPTGVDPDPDHTGEIIQYLSAGLGKLILLDKLEGAAGTGGPGLLCLGCCPHDPPRDIWRMDGWETELLKNTFQAEGFQEVILTFKAVIHEIQRIANTVPLSVFHRTTRDTELMGYSIPKGTIIIQNLISVLSEEGQWKFSREFNPENFLNDQGEFVKPEAFMPFSAGPRMCLGEGLARMELFLILVTLLRKFKFIWPEDAGEPDFTPVYGVTLTPKPYRMKVQLRTSQ